MSLRADPTAIEKIRKVLAKAGNNPSVEEAETAAMMAQRLLLRHGLTMDEVIEDVGVEGRKEKVVTEGAPDLDEYRYAPWWVKNLSNIIAKNFRCFSVIRTYRKKGSHIVFVGLSEDVEVATLAYKKIKASYKGDLLRFIRERRRVTGYAPTAAQKNTYTTGFLAGLRRKFEENVAEYALVLVKDQMVVDHETAMKLKQRRRDSFETMSRDKQAWETGFNDGQRAGAKQKEEPLEAKPAFLAEGC